MPSPFQLRLQEHLKASNLTPGVFPVNESFKALSMAAVLVGDKPILLTGAGDDAESLKQAERFTQSKAFKAAMSSLALVGTLRAGVVDGQGIDWPQQCEAVVGSEPGVVENDGSSGELKMISLHTSRSLTTLLCVNTELACIVDPAAPLMDDGRDLTELLSSEPQVLTFQ